MPADPGVPVLRLFEEITKLGYTGGLNLVELEPFLTGPEQDHDASVAGLALPCSAGPIEGINTKPS